MGVLTTGIKEFLVPGSDMFLVLGLTVGVCLLYFRGSGQVWGRRWLLGLLVMYGALALPLTSDALFAGLSRKYHSLRSPNDAQGAQVIVVFTNGVQPRRAGGGSLDSLNLPSAFGALETARLYYKLKVPRILASGGPYIRRDSSTESEVMRAALIDLGIPRDVIEVEAMSTNTREQAVNVSAWLRDRHIEKFVLVTSPEHMLRAVSLFEKNGIQPIPSISQLKYGGTYPAFWPTRYALQGSEAALYEYMALAYYWVRGWV